MAAIGCGMPNGQIAASPTVAVAPASSNASVMGGASAAASNSGASGISSRKRAEKPLAERSVSDLEALETKLVNQSANLKAKLAKHEQARASKPRPPPPAWALVPRRRALWDVLVEEAGWQVRGPSRGCYLYACIVLQCLTNA